MKKRVFAMLALMGFASFGANLKAVKLNGDITINGKMDDPAWKTAMVIDKFYIDNSDKLSMPAKAYLLYDNHALYAAFRVPIPAGKTLKVIGTKRDSHDIYKDDCVEIMIDPNKTGDRYFHFLVNSKGAFTDRYCDQGGHVANAKWDGEINVKCKTYADEWICEMRIPYHTLDITPGGSKLWGFNFAVNWRNPRQEASAAANGVFHNASAFLPVEGIEIDLKKYGWETSPVTVNCHGSGRDFAADLTIPVTNLSNTPQKVMLKVVLMGDNVIGMDTTRQFKPGEEARVPFSNIKIAKQGDYTCIVGILDPVTQKPVKRRFYPVSFKYAPFEIDVKEPHYRNFIYATQNLKEVVYSVKSSIGKDVTYTTGIRTLDGKVLASRTMKGDGECRFPVSSLPDGKMQIFVSAGKGKEAVAPLRKLPYQKGEAWIDKKGFIRVDGKRYFIILEWNAKHLEGTKVSSARGKNRPNSEKYWTGDLMWSNFPARKSYVLPAILPEHEKIMRKTIRGFKDDPKMLVYYLSDEPEIKNINASGLTHAAEIIRDEDPYHLIFVSNDTVTGAKDFVNAAELNGLHPYPNPQPGVSKFNFDRVVSFMDQTVSFNKSRRVPQIICYAQQGFNYGDFGSRNSRIPTFDEMRTQYLMSLILGGKAIETYTRNVNIYPELQIGFPAFMKELHALEGALLEDDLFPVDFKNSNKNVRTMLKKHNGEYWLFAVSVTKGKEKAVFTLPEIGGRKLNVVSEARTVQAKNGSFSDTFDNFQVHIYTTAPAPELESLASIEKRIRDANGKRRKPGNLAFQMFEYDLMNIRASSNKSLFRREDSCLWHVTDGNRTSEKEPHYPQEIWHDATPNKCPDWIELSFKKPVTAKKAVVAVLKKSVRDFQLQAMVDGNWKTLAEVKDGNAPEFTLNFAPVTSDKFRLFVTKNNGKFTLVDEIELY